MVFFVCPGPLLGPRGVGPFPLADVLGRERGDGHRLGEIEHGIALGDHVLQVEVDAGDDGDRERAESDEDHRRNRAHVPRAIDRAGEEAGDDAGDEPADERCDSRHILALDGVDRLDGSIYRVRFDFVVDVIHPNQQFVAMSQDHWSPP